jgi:hypothetical protein
MHASTAKALLEHLLEAVAYSTRNREVLESLDIQIRKCGLHIEDWQCEELAWIEYILEPCGQPVPAYVTDAMQRHKRTASTNPYAGERGAGACQIKPRDEVRAVPKSLSQYTIYTGTRAAYLCPRA